MLSAMGQMILGLALMIIGVRNFRDVESMRRRLNVAKAHRPIYARIMGTGLGLMGVGIALNGVFRMMVYPDMAFYILAVCGGIGLICVLLAQIRYHKGLSK